MKVDAQACLAWQEAYRQWRARADRKMHELPPKPAGYDLWLQGDNPLGLELTQGRPGHLIDPAWKPSITTHQAINITYVQSELKLP